LYAIDCVEVGGLSFQYRVSIDAVIVGGVFLVRVRRDRTC
jgi:hypothetical protein